MPSEQEDARAQELEALRRYFAELGVRPNRPAVKGTEPRPVSERQRRPSPRLLFTGLLVVVALAGGVLVGAVAWSDDRPADGTGTGSPAVSSANPRPTTTGPMASAACKTAVDRANAMLASAVKLRRVVAEQGRILRDPANRRLSGPQLLREVAPALQAGSSESARFDHALAEYQQVVDRCQLQAP